KWRDRDRYAGVAIDSSGTLPDGTPINSPDDVRNALLRRPEQFVQTFTEGLLTYATGRTLEPRDMPTVRRIVRGSAASDYRRSSPKRFAFVGFPHGAIMDRWAPKQTGADYEMSTILAPLAPFRDHMTVVSGLRNKPGETPEPHAYIESTWLSCVKPWEHGVTAP